LRPVDRSNLSVSGNSSSFSNWSRGIAWFVWKNKTEKNYLKLETGQVTQRSPLRLIILKMSSFMWRKPQRKWQHNIKMDVKFTAYDQSSSRQYVEGFFKWNTCWRRENCSGAVTPAAAQGVLHGEDPLAGVQCLLSAHGNHFYCPLIFHSEP
jgi:hypothetical protein